MANLDVKSLFTNIPENLAIDLILNNIFNKGVKDFNELNRKQIEKTSYLDYGLLKVDGCTCHLTARKLEGQLLRVVLFTQHAKRYCMLATHKIGQEWHSFINRKFSSVFKIVFKVFNFYSMRLIKQFCRKLNLKCNCSNANSPTLTGPLLRAFKGGNSPPKSVLPPLK